MDSANRYRINISIVDKDGDKHDLQVAEGDNLLDIAQANDLEMEGSHPDSVIQRKKRRG